MKRLLQILFFFIGDRIIPLSIIDNFSLGILVLFITLMSSIMHLKYQSLYNDDFEYSIKRLPRVYKKLFYLSHYVYVNFKPRK